MSRSRLPAPLLVLAVLATMLVALPGQAATSSGTNWNAVLPDGRVVFDADDGTHGRELWVTDLTGAGTRLLHDTDPRSLEDLDGEVDATSAGGPAYYLVDGASGEIWRTDGDDVELVVVPTNGFGDMLAIPGGLLFTDGDSDLWFVADDSTAPTLLGADADRLFPSHAGALVQHSTTNEVRHTDGTPAGTVSLGSTTATPINDSLPGASVTYLAADDELWVIDGSAGDLRSIVTTPHELYAGTTVGDRAFLSMDRGDGDEPQVLDGTSITQLADIGAGTDAGAPAGFASIGSTVVFVATADNGDTSHLWATGGTPGTTTALTQVAEGDHGGYVAASTGDFALLQPQSSSLASVLTDGTAGGTSTLPQVTSGSQVPPPAVSGDQVLFFTTSSAEPDRGQEPWVTDGTVAGTRLLVDVHASPSVDDVLLGDTVTYVVADTPAQGPSVWRLDRADPSGSPPELVFAGADELVAVFGDDLVMADNGTYWVHEAATSTVEEVANPITGVPDAVPAADGVYFIDFADDVHYLDVSGGAPYATVRVLEEVVDGYQDFGGSFGSSAIGFGPDLLMQGDADLTSGQDQVVLLYDLGLGTLTELTSSGDISRAINFRTDDARGLAYFEGQNSTPGSVTSDDIWITDGTPAGTQEIAVTDGLETQAFEVAPNGTIIAPADGAGADGDGHQDVYAITDPGGTPAITRWSDTVGESGFGDPRIETVAPVLVDGTLMALAIVQDATTSPRPQELVLVVPGAPDVYFDDIADRALGSLPDDLTVLPVVGNGSPVAFTAFSEAGGREPWVFRPGTRTVQPLGDLTPGSLGSVPEALTSGSLWFSASSTTSARDLWWQASPAADLVNLTAPAAADDALTMDEDTSVLVDVLDNDAARTGTLVIEWADGADHGTTEVVGTQVRYTPDPDFFGSDAFTYRVADDLSIAEATVAVTVEDVFDPTPTPTPSPTPSPTPTVDPIPADAAERIAGDSRAETAVAVAAASHPDGAATVLLARQDAYPDALAGAPLARALDGPILLTRRDELLASTAAAIDDLGATRVVLLGGEGALSGVVADAVAGLPSVAQVDRLGGANRFATAGLIAAELPGAPERAYVTEGANADPARGWPDALSASPLAAAQGRPILLVTRDALPGDTASAIADLGITEVTIVGGEAAVGPGVADALDAAGVSVAPRVAGPSRYATSVAVASAAVEAGADPGSVWYATGLNFPDALVAGPAVAGDGGVMLLLHGRDATRSEESLAWLDTYASAPVTRVSVLGGSGAVSDDAIRLIEARLG